MSDGVPAEPIRIGHVERQAAVEALKHHHEAGRIDAQEYEERSVRAEAAKSRPELEALFTDLPRPHSGRPVKSPETSPEGIQTTLTPGAPNPDPAVAERQQRRGVLNIGEPWATTIVSISPILAVILFFVTDSWLWFLAIPLVALLVYGPDGRYGVGPEAAMRKQEYREQRKQARKKD
jgi:hypothetical protein